MFVKKRCEHEININSFKEKMSFKEFEIKLKKYSVNNTYPNIDE